MSHLQFSCMVTHLQLLKRKHRGLKESPHVKYFKFGEEKLEQ